MDSAVGEDDFRASYLSDKVDEWLEKLRVLTAFGQTEPHAAHAALNHGLRSRYTFLVRTLPDTGEILQGINKFLAKELLHALSRRKSFTTDDLSLLRLQARLGGIGLPSLAETAESELKASKEMTRAQVLEIVQQNLPHDASYCYTFRNEKKEKRASKKHKRLCTYS